MSKWKFRKDSLLKDYLVDHLPENRYGPLGFAFFDETTPGKVISALERIFAKNDMYDDRKRPNYVICDDKLRYIVGSAKITLHQRKLHLKRIVYSHLYEIKEIVPRTYYHLREEEFPPLGWTPVKQDVWKVWK